jgi:solute carrier family 6 GABA transporter-like protein 6/8/11/12/13
LLKADYLKYLFQGGIYLFQIVDYYAAAMTLMYIAFFECAAIVWIYGTKRLSANIKDMTGQYPNFMYRFCWKFISPFLIFVSFPVCTLDIVYNDF